MEKLYKNEQIMEAFIGTPDKYRWYKNAFSKYDVNGIEKFSWNWSWYAFLGSLVYLVYRKCYVEALILWVASIVLSGISPSAGLFLMIGCGGGAPFLVYRKYKKIVEEVQENENNFEKQLDMVRELGGVNTTGRNIAIIVSCFGLIFIGILSAMIGVLFSMGMN